MDKIIAWIKKKNLLIGLMAVIGVPLVIYILSVVPILPSGKNNDWAGFWGGYIGAIIGGLCTVIGVYWTIQDSQKNFNEDVRNRSLPYISLTTLQYDRRKDLLTLLVENDSDDKNMKLESIPYREYRLERTHLIIDEGKISFKKELTEEQRALVESGGVEPVHCQGRYTLTNRGIISIPFELENVGNGAAVFFRFGLYRSDDVKPVSTTPISLKVGEKIYVHIFSSDNNIHELNFGDYKFEVFYNDTIGYAYSQIYNFSIKKDEKRGLYCSLDLSGKQIQKIDEPDEI